MHDHAGAERVADEVRLRERERVEEREQIRCQLRQGVAVVGSARVAAAAAGLLVDVGTE